MGVAWKLPQRFCDGAEAVPPPVGCPVGGRKGGAEAEYVAYYRHLEEDVALDSVCTTASIAHRYRNGVEAAVSLLLSADGVGLFRGKKTALLADRRRPLTDELQRLGDDVAPELQQGAFVDVGNRVLRSVTASQGRGGGDEADQQRARQEFYRDFPVQMVWKDLTETAFKGLAP